MKPIRVLVVDDHVIVRKGIVALLSTEPDIDVVGEATNGHEAVDAALALKPDVIVMDLVMPGLGGIEAIQRITSEWPSARILVLTSFSSDEQVLSAIRAGAAGYHLKDSDPEELERAIRQVHRGESSLHPTIARKVLSELTRPRQKGIPDPLTAREVDVLRLVATGCSNQQVADRLFISEVTVRTHMSNILGKLHLASRTQAALWALRKGIASLDEDDVTGR